MKCMMCGTRELTTGDASNICPDCQERLKQNLPPPMQPFYETVPAQYGWICPKCGSVYAPYVNSCFKCNGPDQITCLCEGSHSC